MYHSGEAKKNSEFRTRNTAGFCVTLLFGIPRYLLPIPTVLQRYWMLKILRNSVPTEFRGHPSVFRSHVGQQLTGYRWPRNLGKLFCCMYDAEDRVLDSGFRVCLARGRNPCTFCVVCFKFRIHVLCNGAFCGSGHKKARMLALFNLLLSLISDSA